VDDRQTICDWIDAHRRELTELLSDLVAARTENPPGNETEAAQILKAFFDRYGISSEMCEAQPGRASIVARIGDQGKSLFIPGHLDVVPAGDGWTVPPFEATFRDGLVYGRGVADNKGPTAAVMLAGACVKSCFDLAGVLLVAGLADEERGSAHGLEYLLGQDKLHADYAIVPDIAGHMKDIDVAEKGLLHVDIVSHGRQAHGSTPEKGVNAIWNLLAALDKLRRRGIPGMRHSLLGPPTLSLGQIRGGVAPNVVPGAASATLDIRFLPKQSAAEIMECIGRVLRRTEAEVKDARFDLEQKLTLPATEAPADNPLIEIIQDAAEELLDRNARPMGMSGATLTKQLLRRGIPAVGFGVGDAGVAHMADERIEVEELVRFAKVMALISVRFLGVRQRATPP